MLCILGAGYSRRRPGACPSAVKWKQSGACLEKRLVLKWFGCLPASLSGAELLQGEAVVSVLVRGNCYTELKLDVLFELC